MSVSGSMNKIVAVILLTGYLVLTAGYLFVMMTVLWNYHVPIQIGVVAVGFALLLMSVLGVKLIRAYMTPPKKQKEVS